MEHCQECHKNADHLAPCALPNCPVAKALAFAASDPCLSSGLDEIAKYLSQRMDTRDGGYGRPLPNEEMTLYVKLDTARKRTASETRDTINAGSAERPDFKSDTVHTNGAPGVTGANAAPAP